VGIYILHVRIFRSDGYRFLVCYESALTLESYENGGTAVIISNQKTKGQGLCTSSQCAQSAWRVWAFLYMVYLCSER